MNSDALICLWILVFPIGIIELSTSRKWYFWLYFSFLHDYWTPSNWKSLVHTSWGEMERCDKCAFQLLKLRRKWMSWNIKTKCVTDFLLTVSSSSMKIYNYHCVVITQKTNFYIIFNKNNENFEMFCLQITGYLNTRKSFPICIL